MAGRGIVGRHLKAGWLLVDRQLMIALWPFGNLINGLLMLVGGWFSVPYWLVDLGSVSYRFSCGCIYKDACWKRRGSFGHSTGWLYSSFSNLIDHKVELYLSGNNPSCES
jgi:hypothetical protein